MDESYVHLEKLVQFVVMNAIQDIFLLEKIQLQPQKYANLVGNGTHSSILYVKVSTRMVIKFGECVHKQRILA